MTRLIMCFAVSLLMVAPASAVTTEWMISASVAEASRTQLNTVSRDTCETAGCSASLIDAWTIWREL